VPWDRHFFGVRETAVRRPNGTMPTFYFLGADKYGQDVFSRLIYGSRISLSVGLVSIAVTFVLGVIIGGISGYIGGTVDTVIQRFIEIVNAFPQIRSGWPSARAAGGLVAALDLFRRDAGAQLLAGRAWRAWCAARSWRSARRTTPWPRACSARRTPASCSGTCCRGSPATSSWC